jgi:hypothetical protein
VKPTAAASVLAVRLDQSGMPSQSAHAWTILDLGTESGVRSPLATRPCAISNRYWNATPLSHA